MIQVITPSTDKNWDDFVLREPSGTIFHTANWARVIQQTYGYEPYFIANVEDGEITAGIPFFILKGKLRKKRLVSLPFTDECPPLFTTAADLENVVSSIIKMMKKGAIGYIEIRGGNFDFEKQFAFKKYSYYKKFLLNLSPGLDILWRNFKQKSVRYPIKKAQRHGVEIIRTIELHDMEIFYRLNLLTRRKHGVIPQPFKFFKNIVTEIFNAGLGFLLIARYGKKPIGASVFFTFKDVIYYKFNASHPYYLEYQPNHLILWSAIQWGVENGYRKLDLGRTAPDNQGLMAFKRHWGAQEADLPYYHWPEIEGVSAIKESSKKYQIASSILKKLPLPVLEFSGRIFYKYLG